MICSEPLILAGVVISKLFFHLVLWRISRIGCLLSDDHLNWLLNTAPGLLLLPCGTAIVRIDSHEILVEGIVGAYLPYPREPLVDDGIAIT